MQNLAIAENHRQEIVEVVRDAARKLTDRLHLRALANLLLELPPLGNVANDGTDEGGLAIDEFAASAGLAENLFPVASDKNDFRLFGMLALNQLLNLPCPDFAAVGMNDVLDVKIRDIPVGIPQGCFPGSIGVEHPPVGQITVDQVVGVFQKVSIFFLALGKGNLSLGPLADHI